MLHVGRSIECSCGIVNSIREDVMYCMGYEALTTVVMTTCFIFRDITPLELAKQHYITEDGTFQGNILFFWAKVLGIKLLVDDFKAY
jgi:hypothetical protein